MQVYERILKQNIGRDIRVVMRGCSGKEKETISGKLVAYDNLVIVLLIQKGTSSSKYYEPVAINKSAIERIENFQFDFEDADK